MRITHCLLSCDSNPEYLDFWPVIAGACLKLGIRPVLFYIATDKNCFPAEIDGCPVHAFEPLPEIPVMIQASVLRYWGCMYYPEDFVMVGEMDLIPLSKKFFIDRLREVDDDSYVHVPPKPKPEYGVMTADEILHEYPIDQATYLNAVYHIGRGDTLFRVLGFSDSWEESCRMMVPHWFKMDRFANIRPREYQVNPTDQPAYGDEVYPTLRVALARHHGWERIELLPYSEEEYNWICRTKLGPGLRGSELPAYDEEKLRAGYYSALHAPRPYSEHKAEIDRFLALHESLFPSDPGIGQVTNNRARR